VFKIESSEQLPYEKVQAEVQKELQQAGLQQWLESIRSGIDVKVENEAYFKR
jgi:hypothetical protein